MSTTADDGAVATSFDPTDFQVPVPTTSSAGTAPTTHRTLITTSVAEPSSAKSTVLISSSSTTPLPTSKCSNSNCAIPIFSDNWAIGIAIGSVAVAVLMFAAMFLLERRQRALGLNKGKGAERAVGHEYFEMQKGMQGLEAGPVQPPREITSRSGGYSQRGWDDMPEYRRG